jgi:exopolyphosphatase / guanosine-5'-triphosphate,3'-diphosphate pyrophosphatase
MRYASIDIGTNTILMLIGEVDRASSIRPLRDLYSVPRIGKSVSQSKRLDRASISRAIDVLTNYRAVAEGYAVDRIVASATSAVRDAENRDDFIKEAREACGIEIEVIRGETEARLGFIGAISGDPDKSLTSLVIDIGGGSTEFSEGIGTEPSRVASIDIGAVRLTELFFRHNPPTPEELHEATAFVEKALKTFPFSVVRPDRVFGVAGTATTIALVAQKKYEFEAAAVNNFRMSAESLREVFNLLKTKSPSDIRKLTNAAEGREDVLLAGTLILMKALEAAGARSFLATDRGLRYGYLLYKHAQMSGQ